MGGKLRPSPSDLILSRYFQRRPPRLETQRAASTPANGNASCSFPSPTCRAGMPNGNRRTRSRSVTAPTRITWEQLERNANRRARAFAAKGVKPGDFVAIGLPNSNCVFRDHLCGVEMRRDADIADLAAAARRGRRGARHPQAVAGGRRPARLECAEFAARRFRARRRVRRTGDNPVARYWKAMTSGGSTGRPKVILDHRPAVIDTAGPGGGSAFRSSASLLNPGPLYHNAPFIVSHSALFTRRTRHRPASNSTPRNACA